MSAFSRSIKELKNILRQLNVTHSHVTSAPILRSVWVEIHRLTTIENEYRSIHVNPLHFRPIRIHRFESETGKHIASHEFYPTILTLFIKHLLETFELIRPTIGWDPSYIDRASDRNWRYLKTGMGNFEFWPIHGDPRQLVEVIPPRGRSLLFAREEMPDFVFGLLRALKGLHQMFPANHQLEFIYGCNSDNQTICSAEGEAYL